MSIKMTEVYAQSEIPATLLSGGRINIYSQQEQAYTIFQTIHCTLYKRKKTDYFNSRIEKGCI
jgi:hypothetical protein